MAINLYEVHEREQREAAHAEFMLQPNIEALISKAAGRGFRKASIQEIHASVDRRSGWSASPDLFSWRGGLWAKSSSQASA